MDSGPLTQKLSEILFFGGFVKASLPRHDWLHHRPLVTELGPLASSDTRSEGGANQPNPLIRLVPPNNQQLTLLGYLELSSLTE